MKKRILSIVLFLILLFGSCFAVVFIKSSFGHLPLFFLTQDNVSKIVYTKNCTEKGSTTEVTLSEREKMIFISMYSKKLRLTKSDSKYSLETIRKESEAQGRIIEYFTVYLKPFGKINVEGRYIIENVLLSPYDEKYEEANFAANQFYLAFIDNEAMNADVPPRVFEGEK